MLGPVMDRLSELLREMLEDLVEGIKQDARDVWENIIDLFRGSEVAYPEPSAWDCGAPWNEDEEGGCDCMHCRKRKREAAKEANYDEGDRWDDMGGRFK